jgi:hypothetical protein
LRTLGLADTRVDDSSLDTLEHLTDHEELDLSRTAITDAAVPFLGRLKSLKELRIIDTKVTSRGASALRSQARALKVETEYPDYSSLRKPS